ncbi:hypothetical protein V6N13_043737 [Hibiscus sabdariffa]
MKVIDRSTLTKCDVTQNQKENKDIDKAVEFAEMRQKKLAGMGEKLEDKSGLKLEKMEDSGDEEERNGLENLGTETGE